MTTPQCYAVYSNLQGNKDGKCPFFHSIEGSSGRKKGNILQLPCEVKFHFFTPIFNKDGKPSVNQMAVISYGEHSHPPPPPRKIPSQVKDELLKLVKAFGAAEVTARQLIASLILHIMLNGKTSLTEEHIALTNQDAINHLIRKERLKEHPLGTDFLGVQKLMLQQGLEDPYIRATHQYPDGHFVILCQFTEQSRAFFQSYEIQVDKTFSRTKCREFEINSYDHATKRIRTLSRVFTDYEDSDGYFQAFNLSFKQAENDIGKRIPWGQLASYKDVLGGICIKAILVDEHGGQIKGLGRYFAQEYPFHDAEWHILQVVKTCPVHYERSIRKLEGKGLPKGLYLFLK